MLAMLRRADFLKPIVTRGRLFHGDFLSNKKSSGLYRDRVQIHIGSYRLAGSDISNRTKTLTSSWGLFTVYRVTNNDVLSYGTALFQDEAMLYGKRVMNGS